MYVVELCMKNDIVSHTHDTACTFMNEQMSGLNVNHYGEQIAGRQVRPV